MQTFIRRQYKGWRLSHKSDVYTAFPLYAECQIQRLYDATVGLIARSLVSSPVLRWLETGQMSVQCQHFQNPTAVRQLGWRRWHLARRPIFYESSWDKTSGKWNFEFRPLPQPRATPNLAWLGDNPPQTGVLIYNTQNSNKQQLCKATKNYH